MRLDAHLIARCRAVGLDPDDMEALWERSGSIGPVLATIGSIEMDRELARDRSGTGPVGVGRTQWRTDSQASVRLTVRLDRRELAELRRQADGKRMGVSVLARCYIRNGIAAPPVSPVD